MATTINADTSEGLKLTSDTSGDLNLQSSDSTIVSVKVNGVEVEKPFTVKNEVRSYSLSNKYGMYRTGIEDENFLIGYDSNHDTWAKGIALKANNSDGFVFFSTNGAERLRIDKSGNVGIGTDNPSQKLEVVGDMSAEGIYLGGTASSNLLDNYEEGSWTPALTAVTPVTSVAYTHRSARYIRIGSLVYVTGAFQVSSRSGGSGQVIVGGLPFNVSDELPSTAVEASGYCSYFGGLTQATSAVGVWAFNGSTNLYFTAVDPAGSTTMPKLELANTSTTSFQLRFTISYITDDE
jgi:hypothetical protein